MLWKNDVRLKKNRERKSVKKRIRNDPIDWYGALRMDFKMSLIVRIYLRADLCNFAVFQRYDAFFEAVYNINVMRGD
jgi:hypothetical protein